MSNQPPSPGPAARAEGKRSLARDLSWAAFGLVIGVLAMRASNSCVRPGVVSHEPASADTLLAPEDSAKHRSSWWKGFWVWINKQNGPISDKSRKRIVPAFWIACIVCIASSGWIWCHKGWNWGLLLLCVQVAYLSVAAGPLFTARWASLIAFVSLVATVTSCWLSPPWDTTPKVIEPVFDIGGYKVTSGGKCNLKWSEDNKKSWYACELSVAPVSPSPPTVPSATPAK